MNIDYLIRLKCVLGTGLKKCRCNGVVRFHSWALTQFLGFQLICVFVLHQTKEEHSSRGRHSADEDVGMKMFHPEAFKGRTREPEVSANS